MKLEPSTEAALAVIPRQAKYLVVLSVIPASLERESSVVVFANRGKGKDAGFSYITWILD